MKGIVQSSPGEWRLDVQVCVNHKSVRKRELFTGGKKEAAARFAALKQELLNRATAQACSLTLQVQDFSTFGECLDFYIKERASQKCNATSYFKRLQAMKEVRLSELSKTFKEFIRLESRSISKRTGETLTPAALNKLRGYASAALNFAVEEERIAKNPLAGLKKDRVQSRWVTLNEHEDKAILDAVQVHAPDLFPLISYMMEVPARRGEMVKARREFFDPFRNQINLPGDLTKNGRPNVKPVPPHMVQYFRSIPRDCPWLFYRKDGSGYKSLGFIQKRWEKVRSAAGLPTLRIHDLRHHAVTKMIRAGNPREYVMAAAGWASDMLSLYWNQPQAEIAQSIIFIPKSDSKSDSSMVLEAESGEIEQISAVS